MLLRMDLNPYTRPAEEKHDGREIRKKHIAIMPCVSSRLVEEMLSEHLLQAGAKNPEWANAPDE